MRLLVPTVPQGQVEIEKQQPPEILAGGWQLHLEAAAQQPEVPAPKELSECPRCHSNGDGQTQLRAGQAPGSFGRCPLGFSWSTPAGGKLESGGCEEDRVGDAYSSAPLEPDRDDESILKTCTLPGLLEWLGPQAPVLQDCVDSGKPLDLVEEFCDEASLSAATERRGGRAIRVGLTYGHDLRGALHRAYAKFLLRRVKVRHYWGSFPCRGLCAFVQLNLSKGCDLRQTLREGRLFLRHATAQARWQREQSTEAFPRAAHLENPLTSAAWRTSPLSLELREPGWLHAKPDQCAFGKRSPQGNFQKKPTSVWTLAPAMRDALDVRCPGGHTHDHVEGSAVTAAASHYPPKFAQAAALVIMGGEQGASGRGRTKQR